MALTAGGPLGCSGAGDAQTTPHEHDSQLDEHLYGLGATGKAWPNGVVPVCWNSASDHKDLQAKVPGILANSWSLAANITFTGFGACGTGNQITVSFADLTDPNPLTGGPDFRGVTDDIGYGARRITLISDDTADLTHFTYEVIHEFGHALGFVHEMKRPTNWSNGIAAQCGVSKSDADYPNYAPEAGGLYLTSTYDSNSVMNYCNPAGYPTTLSTGDITGASSSSAYGPSKLVRPVARQNCSSSIVDCYGHIGFRCDLPVSPRSGDHPVLKRDLGGGIYQIVASDPNDFVDYTANRGQVVNYEVCTENGLLETCTSPITVKTVVTQLSCSGSGSGGDPNNVNGLNPTCGKPPLPACANLSQKP